MNYEKERKKIDDDVDEDDVLMNDTMTLLTSF